MASRTSSRKVKRELREAEEKARRQEFDAEVEKILNNLGVPATKGSRIRKYTEPRPASARKEIRLHAFKPGRNWFNNAESSRLIIQHVFSRHAESALFGLRLFLMLNARFDVDHHLNLLETTEDVNRSYDADDFITRPSMELFHALHEIIEYNSKEGLEKKVDVWSLLPPGRIYPHHVIPLKPSALKVDWHATESGEDTNEARHVLLQPTQPIPVWLSTHPAYSEAASLTKIRRRIIGSPTSNPYAHLSLAVQAELQDAHDFAIDLGLFDEATPVEIEVLKRLELIDMSRPEVVRTLRGGTTNNTGHSRRGKSQRSGKSTAAASHSKQPFWINKEKRKQASLNKIPSFNAIGSEDSEIPGKEADDEPENDEGRLDEDFEDLLQGVAEFPVATTSNGRGVKRPREASPASIGDGMDIERSNADIRPTTKKARQMKKNSGAQHGGDGAPGPESDPSPSEYPTHPPPGKTIPRPKSFAAAAEDFPEYPDENDITEPTPAFTCRTYPPFAALPMEAFRLRGHGVHWNEKQYKRKAVVLGS
ncbi:hypothetical protein CYLTODRAFT_489345 [Cylindrobasidium torrendii FP15055 ss-10]|uniref:Uncharacterized protein n=1 Tax=Cylindrobasidium torrendii FP15055 ss-10 TaxID=1314674 RepID=A0A0D7BFE1_9AGAR|nr:hypothetical protein CYLTODRAFT_489345 [Cylindrobasidium torrendii FP15055 ss-10]